MTKLRLVIEGSNFFARQEERKAGGRRVEMVQRELKSDSLFIRDIFRRMNGERRSRERAQSVFVLISLRQEMRLSIGGEPALASLKRSKTARNEDFDSFNEE